MSTLHDLHGAGQSPWLDNLTRRSLRSGALRRLVDDGLLGVTSNPTIFQRALTEADEYDAQLRELAHRPVVDAYWELAVADVLGALDVLRPVHDRSAGADGYVSIEVPGAVAHDVDATVDAARWLHDLIDRPNVLVKVPATDAGVAATEQLVADGCNVNVTLIFGLDRYAEVIEAYLAGLESRRGDLSRIRSVASFFLSRVDTEVDRRLEATGSRAADDLKGRAAVAQAKVAYQLFRDRFSGPRWDRLAGRGAHVQRPLWASTSTKRPEYADLLYVENLIGPDTVNTMTEATIAAFLDHGRAGRTVDEGAADASATLAELAAAGVDLGDVARTLERQGVAAFARAFDEAVAALAERARRLGSPAPSPAAALLR